MNEEPCEEVMKSAIHYIDGKKVECKMAFPKEKKKKKHKKLKKALSDEKQGQSKESWKIFVGGLPK